MLTTPFQRELWAEFIIGICVFFLRFFARWKVVGPKGLALDDLFAAFALVFWTVDAVTVQIMSTHGSLIGLTEADVAVLTDAQIATMEMGSKALFVAWVSYVSLIWSMKATVLFFYRRLTLGLWQNKFVKIVGAGCVVTYIGTMLAVIGHCTPVQRNWQIKPYVGSQCNTVTVNTVVISVVNICTDLCVLAIPVPLLWKVKIPLRRKLIIGLLLCSGVFVITAALLRCILTLQKGSNILNADIWGTRETFVSIIAVSAPAIRPLFNRATWVTGSVINTASDKKSKLGYSSRSADESVSQELRDVERGAEHQSFDTRHAQRLPDNASEEFIVQRPSAESDHDRKEPLKIEVTTMYELNDSRDSQVIDRDVPLPRRSEGAARPQAASRPQSAVRPQGTARSQGMGWRNVQLETRIVGGTNNDSRPS